MKIIIEKDGKTYQSYESPEDSSCNDCPFYSLGCTIDIEKLCARYDLKFEEKK
jgi:hypothetical protein